MMAVAATCHTTLEVKCVACKDKKCNGGKGTLKKACKEKKCIYQVESAIKKPEVLSEMLFDDNISVVEETKAQPKFKGLSKPLSHHVRKLGFTTSPPKEKIKSKSMSKFVPATTSSIKTLSPEKKASPIKTTDSSWNKDVANIFVAPGRPQKHPNHLHPV